MMRPVYILAHPADAAGCGHHRMIRPVQIMTRCGLALGRHDAKVWPDDLLKHMKPDIVVWQRQHEDHQIENIRRYRKALPDAIMVYETDDALGAVPETSWHRPFIVTDVDERMARAIGLCDILSVSTKPLAEYMRAVIDRYFDKGPHNLQIRIAPNMLGRDDFQAAAAARLRGRRRHPKPRVGWGGGISHTGDLALVKDAIEALADKVQWVFLGMKPENVNAAIEFHQGVPPKDYLAKLASLDLDLMIAPIEDNLFNRCKSNLRLIEGGACSYPVIASAVEPYIDGNPPVFALVKDPADWRPQIESFLALPPGEQVAHGNRLKQWAERHYCMDDHIEERAQLWLPQGRKPFKPRHNTKAAGLTIVCPKPDEQLAELGDVQTSLARACASLGDVLYVSPDTKITREQIDRLKNHLSGNAGAVSALSNDGGLCGFPKPFVFCPMHQQHGDEIDKLCTEMYAAANSIDIQFPSGPVTLISRRALDSWGAPELCEPGHEQEALIEWGIMLSARNMRCKAAPDVFVTQAKPIQGRTLDQAVRRGQTRYPPPGLQTADPVAKIRGELELAFHRERYIAPFPNQKSGYPEWTAYFDTPGPRDLVAMRMGADALAFTPRFGMVAPEGFLKIEPQTWQHSRRLSAATLKEASDNAEELGCNWLVFMREGATVRPHALWMLAREICDHPDAALIYCDHDYLNKDGVRHEHDFKPATFDRDLLLGRDYVTPFFAVYRGSLSGLLPEETWSAPLSEPNLYRMVLELVSSLKTVDIRHVARVLVHLQGPDMNRERKMAAAKAKIAGEVARDVWGWNVKTIIHPRFPHYAAVSYLPPADQPLISIIVPTKDKLDMVQPCVDSLLKLTKYQNYEVLIVDNNSTNPAHRTYLDEVVARDKRVRRLEWNHPYNWSALNNWAVGQAAGKYVLLLNDDTRIVEPTWLDEMVGCASRDDIGAVGARLLYPHGMVQHVGVVCSEGMTGHLLKGLPQAHPGYGGLAILSHECTAVTGACFLIDKDRFIAAGQLDEEMAHNFNDVAICLQLRRMGYRIVLAAGAQVHHIEGATRTTWQSQEGFDLIQAEGRILHKKYPEMDPYWNSNLVFVHHNGGATVSGLSMELFKWPADPWPWRKDPAWQRERVLVIGDDGKGTALEVQDGNTVFIAAIEGFKAKIAQPPLVNAPIFDVRDPKSAKPILEQLGIDRIVFRSLGEAPDILVSFLRRLDIPIHYSPISAEAVCPRRDFSVDGKHCGNAECLPALCAQCIDENGSSFGRVSIVGWRDQWAALLRNANVDLTALDETSAGAIKRVYGNELASAASPAL